MHHFQSAPSLPIECASYFCVAFYTLCTQVAPPHNNRLFKYKTITWRRGTHTHTNTRIYIYIYNPSVAIGQASSHRRKAIILYIVYMSVGDDPERRTADRAAATKSQCAFRWPAKIIFIYIYIIPILVYALCEYYTQHAHKPFWIVAANQERAPQPCAGITKKNINAYTAFVRAKHFALAPRPLYIDRARASAWSPFGPFCFAAAERIHLVVVVVGCRRRGSINISQHIV